MTGILFSCGNVFSAIGLIVSSCVILAGVLVASNQEIQRVSGKRISVFFLSGIVSAAIGLLGHALMSGAMPGHFDIVNEFMFLVTALELVFSVVAFCCIYAVAR